MQTISVSDNDETSQTESPKVTDTELTSPKLNIAPVRVISVPPAVPPRTGEMDVSDGVHQVTE